MWWVVWRTKQFLQFLRASRFLLSWFHGTSVKQSFPHVELTYTHNLIKPFQYNVQRWLFVAYQLVDVQFLLVDGFPLDERGRPLGEEGGVLLLPDGAGQVLDGGFSVHECRVEDDDVADGHKLRQLLVRLRESRKLAWESLARHRDRVLADTTGF